MCRAKKFNLLRDESGDEERASGRRSVGAEGHCPVGKARKPVGDTAAVLAGSGGICPRRQETRKREKRRGQQKK